MEHVEALLEEYYGATLPSSIHKQLGLQPVLVNGGELSMCFFDI